MPALSPPPASISVSTKQDDTGSDLGEDSESGRGQVPGRHSLPWPQLEGPGASSRVTALWLGEGTLGSSPAPVWGPPAVWLGWGRRRPGGGLSGEAGGVPLPGKGAPWLSGRWRLELGSSKESL